MKEKPKTKNELRVEIEELKNRLEEAEETLRAIRKGEVDAVVVSGPQGDRVYTLKSAEQPYRVFVDTMNEGAVTLGPDGTILYCNNRFEELLKEPLERMIGSEIYRFILPTDSGNFEAAFQRGKQEDNRVEISLKRGDGQPVPVYLSFNPLMTDELLAVCMVVTDLTEQKRNEEILKAERLARSILDQATEAVVVCDNKGLIVRASQMAHELSHKNLLFKHFDNIFPLRLSSEADLKSFAISILAPLNGEVLRATEVIFSREDGKVFNLLLSARPLLDQKNIIHGCLVTLVDITERKQIEEALRESEGRYRALVETAPDAVVVHRDNRFLYANSAALRLYGAHTFEQLVAHSISDLLHPNERDPVAERSQLVMSGEKTPLQETRILRLDGREVPVEATAAPVNYQGAKAVQVMIRDITERKQTEQALHQERDRMVALVNSIRDEVWFADATGQFTLVNPSASHEFNVNVDAPIDVRQLAARLEVLRPDGTPRPTEEAPPLRALSGEVVTMQEELIRTPATGELRYRQVSATPVRDGSGNIIGSVSIVRDITTLKRAEESLRRSKERLELLSETASKLLATNRPQEVVNELCQKVMTHLDCHAFFNYLADEEKGRLHLNAYAGIPEENGKEIEWLDYGVAVCGCAAQDGCRIVAENIPDTLDPRTELVKSFGIKAYACHPLLSGGRVIGTLSFGTRSRTTFTEEELSLMKTVADQAAVAMERIRLMETIRKSRDELEVRVQERTREVREQSRILDSFFKFSITPFVILDKDFNFLHVNEAYAKACQRDVAEFPGHNHFEFYPSDAKAKFEQVVQTKRPYVAIARPFSFPDHPESGVTYWDWTLTPILDDAGEVVSLVFSLEDVTERRRAEEIVKAEKQRFNDVLEVLPAYVVLLTPDYHVPFANRVFRERFGESHGKRCFEYLFGRSEPCEICETYTVLKTMSPHHWEWTGPDGRIYDVFDFPFTDTDGSTLILEMGIDITERKKAEEAVRAASLYTRSLIEASLDPLITVSVDGKIMDVNSATELITGVSRDRLIGSDFSDCFTEPEKAKEGYRQVFQTGSVRDYPLTLRGVSGKETDVLYNATVYKNDAGEIQGVFAAARDITARKRGEAALRESENRLRLLSSQLINVQEAERKRIAREIHDSIGQTLAAIKFALESKLSQMGEGTAPAGVSIENIISLTHGGIEESRRIQMDLRPSILDDLGILATMGWFVREYQKVYAHISVEKHISVEEHEIPDSLRTVLFRVTQEAMNNIAKHSNADLVRLTLKKTADRIELSVEDNGAGFDFESVRQGLGLTSMRERAQLSGGSFEIESTLGKGTIVRARWPL